MWMITIRSPEGEPQEYILKPGVNTIGRKLSNDVIISDSSASRVHAEIHLHASENRVTIADLDSTNGTYLNRQRVEGTVPLANRDVIRIGTCLMSVQYLRVDENPEDRRKAGTQPLTRDMVIESFDSNAVLLYDIARQLNMIVDMEPALEKVTGLIKQSMGADSCRILLADQFDTLEDIDFPASIAELAITTRSAVVIPDVMAETDSRIRESALLHRIRSALCAPIQASDDSLLGLIYMYKSDPESRPFSQQDIQPAVAIGHMAALTIERVRLLDKILHEQSIRELLERFVAPAHVEEFWKSYLSNGRLPGLKRQDATVLFSDISDSTGLAERIGTQRFGHLLSRYYARMTEIIFNYGGSVNSYLGDGIMAVFGISTQESEPELCAIRAGMEMLQTISDGAFPEFENLQIGVGVNTGPVMAGYVGARNHTEFTVVGDTVNVAARLQELSRPNRLFIGPITRAAISSEFESVRIGEMELRGRSTRVNVYQVLTDSAHLHPD